ncbi:hypothetical protein EFO91_15400 [Lactiplantibacillus plantarum]|uniref:hypothetical protein n=1 Tax=Lactiplantibacillus plantarum TaxID=1590 RepID=UPI0009771726|nr:hypothetical protein [Lactiplantibacillus plantarum]MCT3226999.1 hypothetical protein [Lactiplantibacillus plantarum]MCT3274369.1 hypothetical protein [Lactiplantibacillus plantarum]RDD76528.1 hypothetical protein DVV32_13445 [Lactiplantibacillus plantarum]
MPENNQTKSISTYNDLAVKLAERIPMVLRAFVLVFVAFMLTLLYSTGYLPSNQRFHYLCIVTITGFISFVLTSGLIYKMVVYIIKNKKSDLLSHE